MVVWVQVPLEVQVKQLKTIKKMETKEVKITIPEGYEIDKENSTF